MRLKAGHEYCFSVQATSLRALPGSSSHEVWQAVRASSAAPYYLDDFRCGAHRCSLQPKATVDWSAMCCHLSRAPTLSCISNAPDRSSIGAAKAADAGHEC